MVTKIHSNKWGWVDLFFDSEDHDIVNSYNWLPRRDPKNGKFYCLSNKNRKTLLIHRIIMSVTDPKVFIDHINGNSMDNRRCNLRVCTSSQNQMNRVNSSGIKGVSLDEFGKYRVRITVNKKVIDGGRRYNNLQDAIKRYNELSMAHHGEFSRINS